MEKLSVEQRVENAIRWIDGLKKTRVKQGQGELGDSKSGYCCLGYGCMRNKVPYDPREEYSNEFQKSVGLKTYAGEFSDVYTLGGIDDWGDPIEADSLAELNDDHKLSFKEISGIIISQADLLFIGEVAKGIKRHYKNLEKK
ncbi:MAG: hypothetical protein PQJ49_04500 [Sphaerochaetaceae bacterium]|nr:hypothetical protein [Sphaerochaetaceae bacterium]